MRDAQAITGVIGVCRYLLSMWTNKHSGIWLTGTSNTVNHTTSRQVIISELGILSLIKYASSGIESKILTEHLEN